jgi:hypothetical protein
MNGQFKDFWKQFACRFYINMNIHLNGFSSSAAAFRENLLPSITSQKKKILLVVSIAFGFPSALYVASLYFFKASKKVEFGHRLEGHGVVDAIDFIRKDPQTIIRLENPVEVIDESVKVQNQPVVEENLFTFLPNELLVSIFCRLDAKGWEALSRTDKYFQLLSKQPEVIASLLDKEKLSIPLAKTLELAKIAGPFLRKLDLSEKSISDQELKDIFRVCPNIKELNLSGCNKLTDAALDQLPEGLKSLDLSFVKLSDVALDQLPEGLKSLDLSFCVKLSDAVIGKLPQGLLSLSLNRCNLTNAALQKLPKGLQSLNLGGCKKLTDSDIDQLPKGLKSLDLKGCYDLTNEALGKLPEGLQSLYLSSCLNLTDDVMDKLPRGLKSLNLSSCDNLTGSAMGKLPQDLQFLNLKWCSNLTDEAIGKLPQSLLSLDLTGCNKLTDVAIDNLPKNLLVLHLHDSHIKNATIKKLPKDSLCLQYH